MAGAFDERIALTVPSHSGCAGSAPFRFIYGNSEQLQNIVGFAPHWFRPDFNRFVGKVDELPLDQHLLKAPWHRGHSWPPRGRRTPGPTPRGRS